MYYLYKDGDVRVIFAYAMCTHSSITGYVLKSNCVTYAEGLAERIYIHGSSEVIRYDTLEHLLEEQFSEFI